MSTIFDPSPPRRTRSRFLGLLALGGAILLFLVVLVAMQSAAPAAADAPDRANVVVQFDAQASNARTIAFTAPISGLKALELTGLAIITHSYSFGDAVCSIAGVGCPADDCFCSTNYWSYWYWDGADWQGYPVGAASSVLSQTGAIEGWRWGQFGDTLAPVTATLQAQNALGWLAPRQTITGDFGGVGSTVEALLALGANGLSNDRAAAYLAGTGAAFTRSGAAAAGKLATAVVGADACLPAGALTPASYYSPTLGAYSTQASANAWAILGTLAMSEMTPAPAIDYLAAQIQPAGGWEWSPGWGVDTNSTALALQALVAAGEPVTATAVISGLAYLESVQNEDGGFPYAGGADATSDANSTAYVVQALVAAGEDPRSLRWTAVGGDPFDYLATLQLADGSFEWQAGTGSNQIATQQAIPALLGQSFPTKRVEIEGCPGIYLPLVSQD